MIWWILASVVFVLIMVVVSSGLDAQVREGSPAEASAPVERNFTSISGIDLAHLDDTSRGLKELGFRHLIDYEAMHGGDAASRHLSRVLVSMDGHVIGEVWQELSDVSATNGLSLQTRFESGRVFISSNRPHPIPDIDPAASRLLYSGTPDLPRMFDRHCDEVRRRIERKEQPLKTSSVEDFTRHEREGWAMEVSRLVKRGTMRRDGDRVHLTPLGVSHILWTLLGPHRASVGLAGHLLWIGGGATIGVLLLFAAVPGKHVFWPFVIGGALGLLYGWKLWLNGLFWSVLVPVLVLYHAGFDSGMIGAACFSALVGVGLGFFGSAGAGADRGRKAVNVTKEGEGGREQ